MRNDTRINRLVAQIETYQDMQRSCQRQRLWVLEWVVMQKIAKLTNALRTLTVTNSGGNMNGITESDVMRARESPIENLFPDHKNHTVYCPFHDDKRPSASIKKGFLYCFTCGRGFDSIEVYRKINGVSFVDAVKALR